MLHRHVCHFEKNGNWENASNLFDKIAASVSSGAINKFDRDLTQIRLKSLDRTRREVRHQYFACVCMLWWIVKKWKVTRRIDSFDGIVIRITREHLVVSKHVNRVLRPRYDPMSSVARRIKDWRCVGKEFIGNVPMRRVRTSRRRKEIKIVHQVFGNVRWYVHLNRAIHWHLSWYRSHTNATGMNADGCELNHTERPTLNLPK